MRKFEINIFQQIVVMTSKKVIMARKQTTALRRKKCTDFVVTRIFPVTVNCFKNYIVDLDKFNLIVGRNNAGKSTLIDALKVISNSRRYAPYRRLMEKPIKLRNNEETYGFYLDNRDIPFSLDNLQYNYEHFYSTSNCTT